MSHNIIHKSRNTHSQFRSAGYANIGFPEIIIENGEDYKVTAVRQTSTHVIGMFNGLSGKMVTLTTTPTQIKTLSKLFFITINDIANEQFMIRLIELAEKINSHNSSKLDYRNYKEVKDQVLIMEDLYKYNDRIYTETSFKAAYPLLFSNVNDVINDGNKLNTPLAIQLNNQFEGIIDARVEDRLKIYGDSETFADKYKVIEKDIYYGYAITAHKSQASTYIAAIVDEMDFQKICNHWNHKHNKLESRIKEKNQLRYVCCAKRQRILY